MAGLVLCRVAGPLASQYIAAAATGLSSVSVIGNALGRRDVTL